MDGIEPGLIDRLVEAFFTGNWVVAVGALMILLAAIAVYFTRDWSPKVLAWFSLGRAVFIAIGAPLYAAGDGYDWRRAVVVAVFSLFAARGFIDQLRALLGRKDPPQPSPGGSGPDDRITPVATPLPRVAGLYSQTPPPEPADEPRPAKSKISGLTLGCLAIALGLSACSGAQHTPTPEDCQVERQVLSSIEAAVEATNIALPVDLEGRSEVIAYSREGIEIGAAAVEACESARDGAPWIRFVSVALKIIRGIVEVLRLVGLDIPGVVGQVLDLLVSADDAHHQPVASFDDTVWW